MVLIVQFITLILMVNATTLLVKIMKNLKTLETLVSSHQLKIKHTSIT